MKYEIKGGAMPVVEIHLEAGEAIRCEGGGMVWMSNNMEMKTQGGGLGKMFGRAFSGESMFQNIYTAKKGPGMITLGSCFPGSIVAVEIGPGRELICQKSAYLGSTTGVNLEVVFQKKLGAGFFGGEGFIMQKLTGNGIAFVEIDGTAIEYTLGRGEQMIIDTGHLAFMDSTCKMDIQKVQGGAKNMLLGGEGLFNTVVTGPGRITLQTMPKNALAAQMAPYIVTGSN
ncbi:MAG: TIGR00266 family protein [Lachnospiraceae bacterium]|nr:TIGR00266 family protein [Lachnospiraceae bacterium]